MLFCFCKNVWQIPSLVCLVEATSCSKERGGGRKEGRRGRANPIYFPPPPPPPPLSLQSTLLHLPLLSFVSLRPCVVVVAAVWYGRGTDKHIFPYIRAVLLYCFPPSNFPQKKNEGRRYKKIRRRQQTSLARLLILSGHTPLLIVATKIFRRSSNKNMRHFPVNIARKENIFGNKMSKFAWKGCMRHFFLGKNLWRLRAAQKKRLGGDEYGEPESRRGGFFGE